MRRKNPKTCKHETIITSPIRVCFDCGTLGARRKPGPKPKKS